MARKRFLVSILLISLIAVFSLPAYTTLYLYPAFTKHLQADAENSATQLARHLINYFQEPEKDLGYEHITKNVKDEINEMLADSGCEKVKIFAPSGEIIYSTDPADIGTVNTEDYFKTVVTQGRDFTTVVRKNQKSAEGRVVTVDVIETYVPLKFRGRIAGASEVYFDITRHRKNIEGLIRHSSAIVILVTSILLILVFVTLYRLNNNMIAREQAEQELSQHRDQLERLVNERTAALRAANIQLQEDIEQQQLTDKALRESEAKYRGLIESASDAIFVIDYENGKIIDVNRKGLELLGRTTDEIIGMHYSQLHPQDEADKYVWLFRKFASHLTLPDIAYHVLHKDGDRIPVEISTSIMDLEGRKIIQGIFRDIRERLKIEEEMQKAERLESVGVMAGGLAHDFNNLLTSILGNISLAKAFAGPDNKVFARLTESEKAIMRAKDLTQQLLTFAKGVNPITKTVDLSSVLVESAGLVLGGANLQCEFSIPENLWPVEADLGQINQVIHNLVLNAFQGMPEGGVCRLEAENILVREGDSIPLPDGRYVKISVHDNGSGISPEHLKKIFDPFFTTKKSGTGLGLPTAYSIIKKHGGLLQVDSEVGRGSVFHIFLPFSGKTLFAATPEKTRSRPVTGRNRVLLMDDDETVRQMAAELLPHLGYEVETAKEGKEVLELYKKGLEQDQKFAAVIVDLTIPDGMGGKDTMVELKKLDPDVIAIVSSGYDTDPILANFAAYGFAAVLPKPYTAEKLDATLAGVLQR